MFSQFTPKMNPELCLICVSEEFLMRGHRPVAVNLVVHL